MPTYRLTLEYEGTRYHGWQEQKNARSVAGELRRAVEESGARVRELGFKPGEETLEVALYEEARIPWEEIAFRTVGATLRHWFADRAKESFSFHAEDLL